MQYCVVSDMNHSAIFIHVIFFEIAKLKLQHITFHSYDITKEYFKSVPNPHAIVHNYV